MAHDEDDADGIDRRAEEREEQGQRDADQDARLQAVQRATNAQREHDGHRAQLVQVSQERDNLSNQLAQRTEDAAVELAEEQSARRHSEAALACTIRALRHLHTAGHNVSTQEMSWEDFAKWERFHREAGELLAIIDRTPPPE